jgi:hypothetical protein
MFSSLPAIAKCLMKTPNMKVHMLERISEMLCEAKVLCEAEIWGRERGWEIVEGVPGNSGGCTGIIVEGVQRNSGGCTGK